jgi:hypothetical protein
VKRTEIAPERRGGRRAEGLLGFEVRVEVEEVLLERAQLVDDA